MAFNGEVGHLAGIESPWGNAGGVVKTVEDVERMAHSGVGWIEAGSYTIESRPGNAVVVDEAGNPIPGADLLVDRHYDEQAGAMYNSLGMPNRGMDTVQLEIPEMIKIAHKHHKALVVNVAPVSHEPVNESIELVSRAYDAGADAVILNAGCPNVITENEDRHELLSRNPVAFGRVLMGLADAELSHKIWVRISPQESLTNAYLLGNQIRASEIVSAVLTPNTWPGHKPLNEKGEPILTIKGNVGGKSGPAMAESAHTETAYMLLALRGSGVDVIRSSGIMEAKELQRSLDIGAVAAAGTTFFYESQNGWREDVDRLLSDLAA